MNKEITKRSAAMVTGAASGIGFSIVKKLLKQGYFIFAIDYDEEKIQTCKKKFSAYKDRIVYHSLDLSMGKEIEVFLKTFSKERKCISVLINNVGYQEEVPFLRLNIQQWQRLFRVNLEAAFLLSQAVAKQMIKKNIIGTIINITSIHDSIIRDIPHYSSSKAALEQLTREMAYSLAKHKIRVNAIAPGAIDTPMIRQELRTREQVEKARKLVPLGELGDPDDIAQAVGFLISNKAKYITGTTVTIDGGLSLII